MKKLDSATLDGEPNTIGVIDHGYVRLVRVSGDDLDVANSARASYAKESSLDESGKVKDRDIRLIKFLIREGHWSPFRHSSMTFEVYAPLMVARQWWRYSVSSAHLEDQNAWSESSRRYITEDEEFYIPNKYEWRSAPENSKQGSGEAISPVYGEHLTDALCEHVDRSLALYERFLDEGMAPEQARLFLPAYGLYVRWRWTVSLEGVLHFLDQRLEHDAQYEIQQYARAVAELVDGAFPVCYDAWRGETAKKWYETETYYKNLSKG